MEPAAIGFLVLMLAVLALVLFSTPQVDGSESAMDQDSNATPGAASGISAKIVREDAPKFAREYRAKLDERRCSIKVTARNAYYGGGRSFSGELNQPNGRWVLFDPQKIADKILDPVLVPLIERCVEEIFALDRAYMGSNLREFTDERGHVWQKV